MRKLVNFPLHPFLIAVFSVFALLAFNLAEVTVIVVIRPVVLLILGTSIIFLLAKLFLKDWGRTGLLTTILVLLFISYGHLYQFLEKHPIFNISFGRHRYLLPLYAILAGLSLWLVLRKKNSINKTTQFLNLFGTVLLLFSIFQLISKSFEISRGEKEASQWTFSQPELQYVNRQNLPDVYFIVLDTYTRKDALDEDFNYDNSVFIAQLEEMGFYVAECSQSNYTYTQGSITSALNLDYLPQLTERLSSTNVENNIWILLKQSLVRAQLERIGYKSVAFETSYEWSRVRDADIFLGDKYSSLDFQTIDPFERLWANSTILILLNDLEIKTRVSDDSPLTHPWGSHIQEQLFVLENLPRIAQNPDPTFTFAHILIPHVPYVFAADGKILNDPGYFSRDDAGPVNEDYLQSGYTGEISFINEQMELILEEIFEESDAPPIIVIMGDHGLRDSNRAKILLALYFPDEKYEMLYPSITPVNSFRVIFDQYFGGAYELLPDVTYLDDGTTVLETCVR